MLPKNLLIGLGVVVLMAGGYIYTRGGGANVATNPEVNNTAVVNLRAGAGETIVSGWLACTPLKSGEAVPEGNCVMGLRGNDGRFYALDASLMKEAFGQNVNSLVSVVGVLKPVDATNPEVGGYKYDAVVIVRAIEAVQ